MKKDNKVRLDLACGSNKQKGYIGVDITKENTQADIEWDLLKKYPWPWEDNSVDEVFASHFLEHIPKGDSFQAPIYQFMDEIYRILKPGGIARFISPYYTSVRAVQDPTHHQFISEPMFNYFSKKWREINKLTHYPVKCDFEIVKLDHAVSEEYTGRAQDAVAQAAMHFWNVVMDLQITLRKPKK